MEYVVFWKVVIQILYYREIKETRRCDYLLNYNTGFNLDFWMYKIDTIYT